MIRVLICDDQQVICDGLEAILGTDPELAVVGVALDGAGALSLLATANPDVVLLDLSMPGLNGIATLQKIRRHFPSIRVLVLTTWADDEWVFEAIRQGASGYLLKGTPRARLLTAIHETAAGQTPIDPAIGAKLFSLVPPVALLDRTRTAATDGLSDREREILCLVARGMSNLAISRELCLSEGTVRNYVSSVLAKLAVPDRTQAAILALKQGLV